MINNWLQAIPTGEAYQINRVLYRIQHDRDEEKRYFANPDVYIASYPELTPAATAALEHTDVTQLYLLGANPYLLRAYCLQLRIPEQDYLAALRQAGKELENG